MTQRCLRAIYVSGNQCGLLAPTAEGPGKEKGWGRLQEGPGEKGEVEPPAKGPGGRGGVGPPAGGPGEEGGLPAKYLPPRRPCGRPPPPCAQASASEHPPSAFEAW